MIAGFQSTRPRGARRGLAQVHMGVPHISIHAPAWGATGRKGFAYLGGGISIHTPAWGATAGIGRATADGGISIHAPAWGATRARREIPLILHHFNPRARVGRDLASQGMAIAWYNFNPRARVKRDKTGRHAGSLASNFNPRARVGRDAAQHHLHDPQSISIHAPAWGATNDIDRSRPRVFRFQSTRPRGARRICIF